MRDICDSDICLNGGYLLLRIFKAVFSELLTLDLFEQLAHFRELSFGHRLLPRRKYDRVFAGGVMFIHQFKTLQSVRQGGRDAGSDAALAGHSDYIFGDFTAPAMLFDQGLHIFRRSSARLPGRQKNMRFLKFLLVIVLAKIAQESGSTLQCFRVDRSA